MQAKGMVEEVYSQKNRNNLYHHMRFDCATWLVKNDNTYFGKLMDKISLLGSGKQASK